MTDDRIQFTSEQREQIIEERRKKEHLVMLRAVQARIMQGIERNNNRSGKRAIWRVSGGYDWFKEVDNETDGHATIGHKQDLVCAIISRHLSVPKIFWQSLPWRTSVLIQKIDKPFPHDNHERGKG